MLKVWSSPDTLLALRMLFILQFLAFLYFFAQILTYLSKVQMQYKSVLRTSVLSVVTLKRFFGFVTTYLLTIIDIWICFKSIILFLLLFLGKTIFANSIRPLVAIFLVRKKCWKVILDNISNPFESYYQICRHQ